MLERNASNRFANVAQSIDIARSQIPIKFKWHTTCNAGKLYPMCAPIEVLPGDEFSITSASLSRMQTPLVPVMDSAYIDTFWFFVPMRLTWEHTKQFFGESDVAGYDNVTQYSIPKMPATVFAEKSLGDYFGIPTKTDNALEVSALPFRSYRLIYNNFFRDQNIDNPLLVNVGDDETDTTLNELVKVNKFHDYFTSALPYAQKGPDILLPMSGNAVVKGYEDFQYVYDSATDSDIISDNGPLYLYSRTYEGSDPLTLRADPLTDLTLMASGQGLEVGGNQTSVASTYSDLRLNNLYADLSNVNSATIIQLRQAFAVQRLYENFALHGSRYYEMLRGSFGVVAPEAYLQIPEYLGGSRQKVNITQVTQVSSSTADSSLGTTGAYSLTTLFNQDFSKSFVEHGYLIGLYCIRNQNSYQQGLSRLWTRSDMLDFYFPELANIGEQPIYNKEIYATGDSASDDLVFGYQERYAEYRYLPSQVVGEFRSNSEQSLDIYHYADYYADTPVLSSSWLSSDPANIDRTIAVPSSTSDQFFCDFDFNILTRRKMPLFGGHSIQGWM